ncbi:uncharacterized protein ColSpa_06066 [Colletotrichum spaethianum]|uniref:Uncharacterized protein n=1 Tax=Colletotrichum spaethianum TaxID=700344 RepID=A0AA37LG14_9PEZI|nr:uncharacterized protein ColSpa_06066 [Colletotrichum spaethianum]GKT45885.1 hypothetical protein ColSpa_06066 [Colletotrichum spaethianum]
MSVNRNVDSVNNKQGEFHPSVPRSEPLTTKGHAPGTKVGNDAYPEFHAQTYPAGTAPKENTFQPNAQDTPGQALNPEAKTYTAANDFPGATSADVHTGLGKPMQGQTSRELHGAHPGNRKKESAGLEGLGASGKDNFRERRLDVDQEPDSRGKTKNASAVPGAEERLPASAEEVASEHR